MSYKQVRKDFEFLESIIPLCDQMSLDAQREHLMQNPTKETAMEMYKSAIELWFAEHPDTPGIEKIAKRYRC